MFHKKKKLQKKLLQSFQNLEKAGAADEDLTLKEMVDEASRQRKELDPDGTNELLARFFEMKDDILERAAKEPLTLQELMELEDVDFFEAIYDRVLAKEDREMNEAEQLFYLISMFDMEIQNGGLCQYFTNTERKSSGSFPMRCMLWAPPNTGPCLKGLLRPIVSTCRSRKDFGFGASWAIGCY